MITPAIKRLYELVWQPGLWMHPDWWSAFDVLPWYETYQRYVSSRQAIDALIIERRQFPLTTLPFELDDAQVLLLNNEERFVSLATILGLLALGERDALFIGSKRRQLASVLSLSMCDQLLSLNLNWEQQQGEVWDGEDPSFLTRVGCEWLAKYAHSPALSALLIRLPIFCHREGVVEESCSTQYFGHAVACSGASVPRFSFEEDPLPIVYKLLRFL